MTIEISSKIVGVSVKKADESAAPAPVTIVKPADVNPLWVRIENRPDGTLEAVSEKISYSSADGRKKVYVLISFLPVDGVLDGSAVTIERPIEFFFPVGQQGSEHQWITATMRNLSLAARGGYVTQALADLRKVVWDKGPVRCGENQWNKPIYHDSEVAAIAWSIQQVLFRRGIVDIDGNQVPAHVLARNYAKRRRLVHEDLDEALHAALTPETECEQAPVAVPKSSAGDCPTCDSNLVMMDGCATCTSCGYSKCA